MAKRVLLVDDSPVIRSSIRNYLESQPSLEVCGEAADGMEGVEKALQLSPDLIVMDLAMPRMNGLDAARVVKRKMPKVEIILFTSYTGVVRADDVFSAGISAIISKGENPELLMAKVLSLLTPVH